MEQLPVRFNPAELARSGRVAQISLPVSHFSRFAAILEDESADVNLQVTFGFTEDRLPKAQGSTRASQLKMTCQRCQQVMDAEVGGEFELVFIASEADAAELPEHLDPVVIGDSEDIDVVAFIEDELILQLPTRVVHKSESECDPAVIAALAGEKQTPTDTHSPFEGLDKLLKK